MCYYSTKNDKTQAQNSTSNRICSVLCNFLFARLMCILQREEITNCVRYIQNEFVNDLHVIKKMGCKNNLTIFAKIIKIALIFRIEGPRSHGLVKLYRCPPYWDNFAAYIISLCRLILPRNVFRRVEGLPYVSTNLYSTQEDHSALI